MPTPHQARLLVLRAALKLEMKGMRRRGQSAYSIIKEEFGLKGNKQAVFDQFNSLIEGNLREGAGTGEEKEND